MALAAAVPCAGHDLPVPGHGTLRLTLPPEWTEAVRVSSGNLPPTFAFERGGPLRATLQVTAMWSPKGEADFTSKERIASFTLATQSVIKATAVEKELPLRPMEGARGTGFTYEATDRDYKAPAGEPRPGDFPIVTQGVLGVDRLLVTFTILSDAKGDGAVQEALAALAKMAPVSQLTRVQGAGVDLRMDLEGLVKKDGEKQLHGDYSQVAFYTSERQGLNFSILVDNLNGMDLADLEKAGISQSQGALKLLAGHQPVSTKVASPEGFLVTFPVALPTEAKIGGYFMQQWYFETIHRGRWLEFHFSRICKDGEDLGEVQAEVERRVRSVREGAGD